MNLTVPQSQVVTQTPPEFANVAIELRRRQAPIFRPLAKMLKERHGARVHAYVRSEPEAEGLRKSDLAEWLATINVSPSAVTLLQETVPDDDTIRSRARAWEERTAEPLFKIALSERQIGNPFYLGAPGYPRSKFFDRFGWRQQVNAVLLGLDYWESEFRSKGITLAIDGGKSMATVARAMGIAYRRFSVARHRSFYFWATDEYFAFPGFRAAFDAAPGAITVNLDQPYDGAKMKDNLFQQRMSKLGTAKRIASGMLQRTKHVIRRTERRHFTTYREIVRLNLRFDRRMRQWERLAAAAEPIGDRPYFYFPLQKEPEIALTLQAPEELAQLELIANIARDLPGGMALAVKENAASVGRRSEEWYRQIAALPQVVPISTAAPSVPLIKGAVGVVTVAGTASFEAAALGVPSIVFTDKLFWSCVDHVRVVERRRDIAEAIRWACRLHDSDPTQRRRDGARLIEALQSAAMDMSGYGRQNENKVVFKPENIETLLSGLISSLAHV